MRRIVSRATPSHARIGRAQFRSRRLRVSRATFALTGTDAALLMDNGKIIAAGAASFSVTGQNVTLRTGRKLSAAAASYALTGQDATLRNGKRLAAGSASFALTGQVATLRRSRVMAAAAPSFALAGQSATLAKGQRLTAGTTSFALSGQTATLKRLLKVAAASTSFVLNGQAATLTKSSTATLVLVGSTTSTSATITLPTGIADGDFGVFVDCASTRSSDSDPALVTPAGYDVRANSLFNPSDRARLAIFTKTLTAAEAATTITGMSSTRGVRKAFLVFRRVPAFASLDVSTLSKQESDSNPPAATADYSGVLGTSITIGVVSTYPEGGTLSGVTFSPAATGSVSVGSSLRVHYLISETAGPAAASMDQNNSFRVNQNMLINFRLY